MKLDSLLLSTFPSPAAGWLTFPPPSRFKSLVLALPSAGRLMGSYYKRFFLGKAGARGNRGLTGDLDF